MSVRSKRRCNVDADNSVNLKDILESFNAPIKEEQTWALCYQCARLYADALSSRGNGTEQRAPCYVISSTSDVYIRTDGNVHTKTYQTVNDAGETGPSEAQNSVELRQRRVATNEREYITGIGLVMYGTLDHGFNGYEERVISENLEQLVSAMLADKHANRTMPETDDEGIERDAEDADDSSGGGQNANSSTRMEQLTLKRIIESCEAHVSTLTKAQTECHYKAVVRAFVTEALDLSTFLDTIAKRNFGGGNEVVNRELDKLQFADWSRFWMQVIAELRMGVKLKKVCYGKAPIEYELTPYEILMKDIRNCRYNLRKIKINKDGDPPSRIRKDAHAIILDFIRSRPPLKKASERKLAPRPRNFTPREQLMHSIRKGRPLRKTGSPLPSTSERRASSAFAASRKPPATPAITLPSPRRPVPAPRRQISASYDNGKSIAMSRNDGERYPKRRLITVDFTQIDDAEEENDEGRDRDECEPELDHEDELDGDEEVSVSSESGESNLWTQVDEMHVTASNATIDKYDLAHDCGLRLPTWRQSLGVTSASAVVGSQSVPQSRPDSRQSCASSSDTLDQIIPAMRPELMQAITMRPPKTNAKSTILDQLSLDNRLSLTLEEIVHIRTVLARADIEALPVEANVRGNVEKRRVCFLCLKTKFGIFGPWGHLCILCKCTVCNKCCSTMNIPMEHFSSVPVVLLSPSIMATPEEEFAAIDMTRSAYESGPTSLNNGVRAALRTSPISGGSRPSSLERFRNRATTVGKATSVIERLRGESAMMSPQQMLVCHDCRQMVSEIIKTAQENRSAIRDKHLQTLTLNLSPMF